MCELHAEVPVPPIEHLRDALLHVVLPPALVAAVVLALPALIAWRAKYRDALTQVAAVVGIAGGLALGLAMNDRALLTTLPDLDPYHWFPLVTLAALIVAAISNVPSVAPGVGWGLRGAVAANAGWLLTPAGLRDEHIGSPIALGAIILAEWAVLEGVAGKGRAPLLAALPAIAASLVAIYASSLRFNQLALILAGGLAGVGIAAAALRAAASSATAAAATILPSLMLMSWYNNSDSDEPVPRICFALVALAPLTLALSLLPAWQRHPRIGLWVLQVLLLLVPIIAAVWIVTATLGPLDYE